METFVGIDGCKAGWFTVALSKHNLYEIDVFRDIKSLWDKYKGAALMLIDIPIGLSDKGSQERVCDLEARKLLSRKRGLSVFRVPCRKAVYASTYNKACEINEQLYINPLSDVNPL